MTVATGRSRGESGGKFISPARAIIGAIRLTLILLALLFGLGVCALASAGVFCGDSGRARFDRIAIRWSRVVVKFLGVRCDYRDTKSAPPAPGTLLVSNHISWLDTLLFSARWRVVFLAKSEVARWPVIGTLAKRAGTLFIEVGRGSSRATLEVADALRRGRTVVLFAEGRTTDGRAVKRFQPRLLQAAVAAGAPVQPVALRYLDRRGRRVTGHSFAVTTLIRGVWRVVAGRPLTAEVTLFAALPAADRQTMARAAEAQVRARVETAAD